jgi:transcriptional regulator GlxA family with amidase domain
VSFPVVGTADARIAELGETLEGLAPAFRRSRRLRRVLMLVESDLQSICAPRVAHASAMTQTAFSHFFKREVGHSFSSWLEIVRVARAVELLRDTD